MDHNTGLSRHQIIAFRLSLSVALVVITYLATAKLDYPVVTGMNDKVSHLLAFYALALLADFSFPEKGFGFSKIVPLLTYGIGIEVIQYHLPFRMFSLFDVAADTIGLIIYWASLPALRYVPTLRQRWDM